MSATQIMGVCYGVLHFQTQFRKRLGPVQRCYVILLGAFPRESHSHGQDSWYMGYGMVIHPSESCQWVYKYRIPIDGLMTISFGKMNHVVDHGTYEAVFNLSQVWQNLQSIITIPADPRSLAW